MISLVYPLRYVRRGVHVHKQLDQQRSDSGIKQETIKAELTDALKQNLIGDSTSRSAHYSLRGASDHALKLYNQKFKQYAKTMEPSVAANKARLDVLTAIENKKGAFSVIGSSEAATGKTQAFYAAFTPGKHPGAPAAINVITPLMLLRRYVLIAMSSTLKYWLALLCLRISITALLTVSRSPSHRSTLICLGQ
jgi:hypothetical protein